MMVLVSLGQSADVITIEEGAKDTELQAVLYFQGISYDKFKVKSEKLKGKNFQVITKEFQAGKMVKVDTVFNSKEDEYFRIKQNTLPFAVFTKMLPDNKFKMKIQFNGFSVDKEYKVLPEERDKFALKSFFGAASELPIDLTKATYILSYMMPYVRPDKSTAYCEVAQSGINPEKLYDTYKIPHYFLVELRFE